MARKFQWDSRWAAIVITLIAMAVTAAWHFENRFDCIENRLTCIEARISEHWTCANAE